MRIEVGCGGDESNNKVFKVAFELGLGVSNEVLSRKQGKDREENV